jgi:hypothetical protein
VAGGWRRLHNGELHNLYASPNIIRVIIIREREMGEAFSTHGTDEKFDSNSNTIGQSRS